MPKAMVQDPGIGLARQFSADLPFRNRREENAGFVARRLVSESLESRMRNHLGEQGIFAIRQARRIGQLPGIITLRQ